MRMRFSYAILASRPFSRFLKVNRSWRLHPLLTPAGETRMPFFSSLCDTRSWPRAGNSIGIAKSAISAFFKTRFFKLGRVFSVYYRACSPLGSSGFREVEAVSRVAEDLACSKDVLQLLGQGKQLGPDFGDLLLGRHPDIPFCKSRSVRLYLSYLR
jgi:hypothetical protein